MTRDRWEHGSVCGMKLRSLSRARAGRVRRARDMPVYSAWRVTEPNKRAWRRSESEDAKPLRPLGGSIVRIAAGKDPEVTEAASLRKRLLSSFRRFGHILFDHRKEACHRSASGPGPFFRKNSTPAIILSGWVVVAKRVFFPFTFNKTYCTITYNLLYLFRQLWNTG